MRSASLLPNNFDVSLQRIVMSAGEETETTFRSDTVILKVGEMWGRRMSDINRYVDGDGKVEIKFIIYHLDLKM